MLLKIAKALTISEFKGLARFDSLHAYYSIAGRDLERDIVPMLQADKTGSLVWSPLAGGLLSGKFNWEHQKPEGSRCSKTYEVDRVKGFLNIQFPRSPEPEKFRLKLFRPETGR